MVHIVNKNVAIVFSNTRCLLLCVMCLYIVVCPFVRFLLTIVLCPSLIYGFWVAIWYFQTLLRTSVHAYTQIYPWIVTCVESQPWRSCGYNPLDTYGDTDFRDITSCQKEQIISQINLFKNCIFFVFKTNGPIFLIIRVMSIFFSPFISIKINQSKTSYLHILSLIRLLSWKGVLEIYLFCWSLQVCFISVTKCYNAKCRLCQYMYMSMYILSCK